MYPPVLLDIYHSFLQRCVVSQNKYQSLLKCGFKVYLYQKKKKKKKKIDVWKKSIAPTFREKGLSSNEIIHFKLKGLRGDYQIDPK